MVVHRSIQQLLARSALWRIWQRFPVLLRACAHSVPTRSARRLPRRQRASPNSVLSLSQHGLVIMGRIARRHIFVMSSLLTTAYVCNHTLVLSTLRSLGSQNILDFGVARPALVYLPFLLSLFFGTFPLVSSRSLVFSS